MHFSGYNHKDNFSKLPDVVQLPNSSNIFLKFGSLAGNNYIEGQRFVTNAQHSYSFSDNQLRPFQSSTVVLKYYQAQNL